MKLTRPGFRLIIVWALWAAVGIAAFWPTFIWMAERFEAHDSFYSHGWLIPVASGWLIWRTRARLAAVSRAASGWGLLVLVPSLAVHVLATWLRIGFASGFAALGVLAGIVWTCWGGAMVRALRVPLLFLLFMIPLPGVVLIAVSFHMKLLAAAMATAAMQLFGMPAVQAGSMIRVPGIAVIVDDTCSGLRSLISLIALSTLWVLLMPSSTKRWQRWTLVAASMPIALVANMVRIIVLVLLSAIYGPQIADSFIHYGSGMVVFAVALAVLAWLSRQLTRQAAAPAHS